MIDLTAQRQPPPASLRRMANAIVHRGPDEEGFLAAPGIGLASRRLSIVGLADGQQPLFNEDRTIAVVFNGELYDYREERIRLEGMGHRFRTQTDGEILVHLWEEEAEAMPLRLRGQFAFALVDFRKQRVFFARDRVGICPLYFAERDGWLLFGSEIKAILASGLVPAEPDPRGLDHMLTFFAMPGERTPFVGIRMLLPGHSATVELPSGPDAGRFRTQRWWDFHYPDAGQEQEPASEEAAIEEFGSHFERAIRRRLVADVPVVSYLSGGVDSATVLTLASKLHGEPLPSFSVRIPSAGLDESERAQAMADQLRSPLQMVLGDADSLAEAFPSVIMAADTPVTDVTGGALHLLSRAVRAAGYKVALTGEGADEALAGYPWFKGRRAFDLLNLPGVPLGTWLRRLAARTMAPGLPRRRLIRDLELSGGHAALAGYYSMYSSVRNRLYSAEQWRRLEDFEAFAELPLDRAAMRRWHPLNQSLYFTYKTLLAGLLLQARGDRAALANSVETRYPLLDEELIDFCMRISPQWKLRGLRHDKYLLRRYAERHVPRTMAMQKKAMFRAPYGKTLLREPPPYVRQLLAPKALQQTGWFDADKVQSELASLRGRRWLRGRRFNVEMGLAGVVATQLWHHIYLGGGLCDLPVWSPPPVDERPLPVFQPAL